eukprot:GHVQ01038787.1.p2 GENE.GHVQ01038787.1~~GHVQ01038787.1.p2  ORF type:complete len:108 (-),score=14.03 GHVQ01038787.1:156-479(-)
MGTPAWKLAGAGEGGGTGKVEAGVDTTVRTAAGMVLPAAGLLPLLGFSANAANLFSVLKSTCFFWIEVHVLLEAGFLNGPAASINTRTDARLTDVPTGLWFRLCVRL